MTTTVLQAINQTLLNIGERSVNGITSPTGQLAFNALSEALRDLETVHRWDWLYDYLPAVSWTAETAMLDNIRTLQTVQVGSATNGFRELQYVTPQEFDMRPLTAYTGVNDAATWYTITGNNEVRLNPYPDDSESRSRVRFYVTRALTIPNDISSILPVPDRFVALLVKRASYLMALRHLDDTTSARAFNSEFQELAQRYRDTERKVSTRGMNMYRRRAGGY